LNITARKPIHFNEIIFEGVEVVAFKKKGYHNFEVLSDSYK